MRISLSIIDSTFNFPHRKKSPKSYKIKQTKSNSSFIRSIIKFTESTFEIIFITFYIQYVIKTFLDNLLIKNLYVEYV